MAVDEDPVEEVNLEDDEELQEAVRRTELMMLTLMMMFLSTLMLILYRRRGRHVFNFETPEHCEQEGENAQKGFNIQTSSKSTLAFPSVSKSPHSIFTNSLHLKSQPISVSYPGFLFSIFLIQDFPFCIFHHFDR